jgi:hypothetical protein
MRRGFPLPQIGDFVAIKTQSLPLLLLALPLLAGCYEKFSAPVPIWPYEPFPPAVTSAAITVDAKDRLHCLETDARRYDSDLYWSLSDNSAASWDWHQEIATHIQSTPAQDLQLAASPTDPDRLYALYVWHDSVLFIRSDQGGSKWDYPQWLADTEPAEPQSMRLVVAPDNQDKLCAFYIANKSLLVRISDDGGRSWNKPICISEYTDYPSKWAWLLDAEYGPDGSLLCTYWQFYRSRVNRHIKLDVVRSTNHGNGWGAPIAISTISSSEWDTVVDSDRDIYTTADLQAAGDRIHLLWHQWGEAKLETSDDGGVSWTRQATLTAPSGPDWVHQDIYAVGLVPAGHDGDLLLGITCSTGDSKRFDYNLYQRSWDGDELGEFYRINDGYGEVRQREFDLIADSEARIYARWAQREPLTYIPGWPENHRTVISKADPYVSESYAVEIPPWYVFEAAKSGNPKNIDWHCSNWSQETVHTYTYAELIDGDDDVWPLYSTEREIPPGATSAVSIFVPIPPQAAPGSARIVVGSGPTDEEIRDTDWFEFQLY